MSHCPYLDGVLIDQRLSRWNVFYLLKLKKMFNRFEFKKVFDLQNSSRTGFYRFLFFKNISWSSSRTSLEKKQKLSELNSLSVLDRMKYQLEKSNLKLTSIFKSDLRWAIKDIRNLINKNFEGKYILIFPFCSAALPKKKWPYFKDLVTILKKNYGVKYNIVIAPGNNEIEMAKKFDVSLMLDANKAVDLITLISLIENSSYIVSNDTGPAHICSHLNKKGLALFGSHTSAKKVNIGSENFKFIEVKDLKKLHVSTVIEKIQQELN
tara:strand:- start:159 stop:956 length:798 start_codon:yes stop_codon:yes gene_type:complete